MNYLSICKPINLSLIPFVFVGCTFRKSTGSMNEAVSAPAGGRPITSFLNEQNPKEYKCNIKDGTIDLTLLFTFVKELEQGTQKGLEDKMEYTLKATHRVGGQAFTIVYDTVATPELSEGKNKHFPIRIFDIRTFRNPQTKPAIDLHFLSEKRNDQPETDIWLSGNIIIDGKNISVRAANLAEDGSFPMKCVQYRP